MQKFVFVVMAAAFVSMGFAGSVNSSLSSFLHPFIGNSTATLAYSNATQGIAIVQVNGNYLAVSLHPYALVTNSVASFQAFRTFMFQNKSLNFSLIGNLSSKMGSLYASSRLGFATCLTYTGLTSSYLSQNSSKGCLSVATCSARLANATIGPIMQEGIVNLSKNYNIFNNSYGSFNSMISNVNRQNYYSYAGELAGYAGSFANVPYALLHNPLFSPPGNFSASLYKNCPTFPTAGTLQNFPWYCQMLRYCQNVAFNYTNASTVKSIAQQLQALPTNSSINATASAAASLASSYISTAGKGNLTLFNEFMNGSSDTISAAKALGAKVSDATLSSLLSRLNSTIEGFAQSNYQNLTATERSISALVPKIHAAYANLSAQYDSLLNLSASAQSSLLAAQLSNPGSADVQRLASLAGNISTELNTHVSSAGFSGIRANLTSIQSSAVSLGAPLSLAAFIKSADSWFTTPILAGMEEDIDAKVASAPVYAALLSVIIGSIALLVFYRLTYHRLFKGKKVKPDKHVRNAWNAVFVIAIIAVITYAAATYVVAASANSSLPIQGFLSRLGSSSSAVIAVDSSLSSNAVQQCVSTLKSGLESNGKLVTYVTEKNMACSFGNSTSDCIDQFMGAGIPIVLITNGSSSYRGMYGYVLYANESYSSGASCTLSKLLK